VVEGTFYDDDTWFEILLIDGPFSMFEADSGGAAVQNNFMYAYDKPNNPPTASSAGSGPTTRTARPSTGTAAMASGQPVAPP